MTVAGPWEPLVGAGIIVTELVMTVMADTDGAEAIFVSIAPVP